MRQGYQYAVSNFTLYAGSGVSGRVLIEKLPDTWMTSGGYKKALTRWLKQQNEVVQDAGAESAVAKFRDFKVFMDTTHVAAGFGANLLPQTSSLVGAGGISNAVPGEWQPSQIVVPNVLNVDGTSTTEPQTEPIEYYLHMVGANNNAGISRGIIEGYADSRAFPQSPDPVSPTLANSDNWMRAMFDVGNDNPMIINNATETNDELPYTQIDYPGGENQLSNLQLHGLADFSGGTTGQNRVSTAVASINGGVFNCGLFKINKETGGLSNSADTVLDVLIQLVPGPYRGYMAQPMRDV
jgi:hypothetical protein